MVPDERVQLRQKSGLSREQAERDTLAFMAKMPAWKHHPRVRSATKVER